MPSHRAKLAAFERCNISCQFPDLLFGEHGPRRHGGSGHAISNDEKRSARIRRLGPRRQCQICRRRVHPLSPLAAAVAAGTVADGAVGREKDAAGLAGLGGRQQSGRRTRGPPPSHPEMASETVNRAMPARSFRFSNHSVAKALHLADNGRDKFVEPALDGI